MQAFFARAQFQFEHPLPAPREPAAHEMAPNAALSALRGRALQNTNGPAPKTCVLARGDYNHPREEVQPGFPAVLGGSLENTARFQSGGDRSFLTSAVPGPRTVLANWIASADNPLTARVMVNRIWQHHFGHGLVAGPSDFGTRGRAPTHPGLLDWLAGEFIRSGWSVKQMHRLILRSATYQLSSTASSAARAQDPENQLLSHQNRVRLEGEVIRDSLLATSGRLNPQMDGPSVALPIPAEVTSTGKSGAAGDGHPERHRRSLYLFARRNLRLPFLEVFDAPDSALTSPERGRSTTAPQSLTLLNSMEVIAAARATANRLRREARSDEERLNLAFRLVLGRWPNPKERAMAQEFIASARHRTEAPGPSTAVNSKSPNEGDTPLSMGPSEEWAELCRALFNLNTFVYAD